MTAFAEHSGGVCTNKMPSIAGRLGGTEQGEGRGVVA
jgi:hypothetical protein